LDSARAKTRQAPRYVLGGVGALLLLSLAVHIASCNEPPDTNYGNPNTLDRKNLPGEGGAEPLVCSGDAAVGKFDGGDCPSFAEDIFPYLAPAGKWRCSDKTCHGGGQNPPLDGTSAAACYASLQKVTVAGKPYIPGADGGGTVKDPTATTFLCNLQGGCGSKMPQAPGADPTPVDLCVVEAWLKCGAPK
jgi:hypothetical protein